MKPEMLPDEIIGAMAGQLSTAQTLALRTMNWADENNHRCKVWGRSTAPERVAVNIRAANCLRRFDLCSFWFDSAGSRFVTITSLGKRVAEVGS